MFKKGQSGNPGGRPRGIREELYRRYGHDGKKLIDILEKLAQSRNPKIQLQATELLLAYMVGKPTQAVNLDVGGDLVIRWATDADA